MIYAASKKLEIIRTVETSSLPVRRTLAQIGIPESAKLSVVGSIPIARSKTQLTLAERAGFEPAIPLRVCRISSAVLSTTQPPLQRVLAVAGGL
jgi:hypothetical protein